MSGPGARSAGDAGATGIGAMSMKIGAGAPAGAYEKPGNRSPSDRDAPPPQSLPRRPSASARRRPRDPAARSRARSFGVPALQPDQRDLQIAGGAQHVHDFHDVAVLHRRSARRKMRSSLSPLVAAPAPPPSESRGTVILAERERRDRALMVRKIGLSGRCCGSAVEAGRSTATSTVASGAAIMKMISSTRMTSMNGVTLISCVSARSSSSMAETDGPWVYSAAREQRRHAAPALADRG